MLREAASAIAAMFGEGREVVVHDLADLDHSVVHVEGNVTNRQVGGCMTNLGLQKVRHGDFTNEYRSLTRAGDGPLDQPAREIKEAFTSDVEEMLQLMPSEINPRSLRPRRQPHRNERVAVIAALDEKGAFNLKRAVSIVGTKLGVSRFTIYNCLNEARGNGRRRSV